MGMAIEQVASLNETADELSKVRIDADGRLQFVERVLQANGSLVDAVVEETRPTAGSLLDSVLAHQHPRRPARLCLPPFKLPAIPGKLAKNGWGK